MFEAILALFLIFGAWSDFFTGARDRITCNSREVGTDARIAACTKLLDRDWGKERRARLLLSRGDAYSQKEDFAHALADYEEAVASNPDNAAAFLGRGMLHWVRLDDESAFKDFDEAVRLQPTADHLLARGSRHIVLKRYDEGIADLTKAIALNPRFAAAYMDRATAHSRKKAFDLAVADYDQVLQMSPADEAAMSARSIARAAAGDDLKSMEDYGRMLVARLQIEKAYPRQAADEKVEGTVMLAFRIDRTGALVASNVKTSSGSAVLDDAALDTLKRAQPFSPLPADSKPSEGFVVPLIFRMPSLHQSP